MGTGVVPAKGKAELLKKKIFLVRKMCSQNDWQLKSLETQNTLHPRFSAATEQIPTQTKFDYLQAQESY